MRISQAQARGAILSQQGLLTPFSSPFDAVHAMVAVQTQYAFSLPAAVATRLAKGSPGWEVAALAPGGSLVKSWSLRNTVHTHLPEDHELLLGVIGERTYRKYVAWMERQRGIHPSTFEELISEALADGPLSRTELHARVPILKTIPGTGWGLDVMGLALCRRLSIVGQGSEQAFAMLSSSSSSFESGQVLARYLSAFGPATIADFSHWTGLPQGEVRTYLTSCAPCERVTIEGMKGERLALPSSFDVEPSGVRLLAKFDPLILAHKDKTLFLAEEHRKAVFRIAAQVEATVLSEGVVCATWRLERKSARANFVFEPLRRLGKREIGRIEKESASLAKKLGLGMGEVKGL